MMMSDADYQQPESQPKRVIKRYSNRKLYDTRDSSYVTLLQIAEMVRAGEDVQIIDNSTKEDKTDVTMALIISEELKARPRGIPLATLKALIRHRSGRILNQLRDGPIGKLMPRDHGDLEGPGSAEAPPRTVGSGTTGNSTVGRGIMEAGTPEIGTEETELTDSRDMQHRGLRATLEQWQQTIDERIRTVLPNFSAFRELQQTVDRLNERVAKLEQQLSKSDNKSQE